MQHPILSSLVSDVIKELWYNINERTKYKYKYNYELQYTRISRDCPKKS